MRANAHSMSLLEHAKNTSGYMPIAVAASLANAPFATKIKSAIMKMSKKAMGENRPTSCASLGR